MTPPKPDDNERSAIRQLSSSGSFVAAEGSAVGVQPPESATQARAKLAEPPAKKTTASPWVFLLPTLALASLALLLALGRSGITSGPEARALATSLETRHHTAGAWFDNESENGASPDESAKNPIRLDWITRHVPVTPRYTGTHDLSTPPGITWTHMAAYAAAGLDVLRPPGQAVIAAGRTASALLGLLTVMAVFWAGHAIGGNRTARSAGLVLIGCPVFLWYARSAAGTIHHACWPAIAIAAATWAIRPLRPAPSIFRQLIGWAIAGLAIGAGFLSTGPVALIAGPIPILVTLLLSPRRISHVLGLLAALLIAGLTVLPWVAVAHTYDPQLWQQWLAQINLTRPRGLEDLRILGMSGVWLLVIFLPWTPWLIGGLVQAFNTSPIGHRRKTAICWSWLLTALAIPVLTGTTATAGALHAALPPAALLIGYVLAQYADNTAEGRSVMVWSILRWPYVAWLFAGSVAVMFFPDALSALIVDGGPGTDAISVAGWPWLVAQVAVLLVIVGFSLRWTASGFPTRALACWALWSVAVFCFALWPLTDPDRTANPARSDAQTVRNLAGNHRLAWYTDPVIGPANPDPALQVYCGQPITPLAQLTGYGDSPPRLFYLLTPQLGRPLVFKAVQPAQATLVGHLPNTGLTLWRVQANPAARSHLD